MLNYVHNIPTTIYFGKGQICHLDEALRPFGKRVLLTYGGGSIKKIGLYDQVMDILNKGGYLKNAFVPLTNEDIIAIFQACL